MPPSFVAPPPEGAVSEGNSQPTPALATSPPGFLPGSVEDADDAAVGTPDPPSAESVQNVSMRGTEQPEDIRLSAALEGPFTLRGELMHCFVSYRVVTEGPSGNKLAQRIAKRIRGMSIEPSKHQELHIPEHGRGIWPRCAKRPVPYRPDQAKVFLDTECLLDGQSWLAGFVQGLVVSMTFVPLLSWTEDDQGSLGELSKIGVNGFDRIDNVLLEMILAMVLRDDPRAAVHAILPVIVGPAAKGGGFETFPFYKLARMSDAPSKATNARAAAILGQLGLGEDNVQAVLRLSVKQVVDSVLRNQGVQASGVEDVATECGTRVLRTVLQEMRRLRSDPKYFERGRPMGSEVLEWLQEENLRSYAPLFVYHRLDSLDYVARLEEETLEQLFDEHGELYPRNGQKGAMGGDLAKLTKAHSKLLCKKLPSCGCLGLVGPSPDERTLPLSERLERYRDEEASGMALLTSGNCLELLHTKTAPRWCWMVFLGALAALVGVQLASALPSFAASDIGEAAQTLLFAVGAALPLVCRTGRAFADATVPWVGCFCLSMLFNSGWDGLYGSVAAMAPLIVALIMTMRYRPKYFVINSCVGLLLLTSLNTLADCIFDYARKDNSYGECVVIGIDENKMSTSLFVFLTLFFFGRKYANDISARRAAREAREQHRVLWREELSKVAATPEVTDGLRRLAGGVAKELQDQKRLVLRSLGVVRRVMAFLTQRVGRLSLRGSRIKARQAHGDIDLLFDEAAMVNEPFLDLMASLVAGVGSTDGESDDAKPRMVLKRGPVKKPARALQKLVRLYGRDVAMLTDLVRCTVLAEDLRQVEALMATLEARSVVGLAGADKWGGEGGDEENPILDKADGDMIFRITAIKNRFDESYDDIQSGGYRDLSLGVEVGWVMKEGVVCFEKVKDWGALECQRHICEIQVRLRSQHHQIANNGLHSRYVELRNKKNA